MQGPRRGDVKGVCRRSEAAPVHFLPPHPGFSRHFSYSSRGCPSALNSLRSTINTPHPRGGQSLIEVLVAIAVLIFGVFTVLRVFPIGFRMLTRTALQGQVQQLADDLAQTVRNGQLQAPEGIVERVPTSNATGWYVPALPASQSGTYAPSVPPQSLKQGAITQNALFSQRSVIGERLTLRVTSSPSLLLLGPAHFPSATPGNLPSAAEINQYMQVYDPRAYTEVFPPGPNMPLPVPGRRQFAVDYPNNLVVFSPSDPDYNTPRYYNLSYRTTVGNVPLDIVDEGVAVTAGTPSTQTFLQGPPLPGSVQLFRAFPYGDGANGTFKLLDAFAGVIGIQPYQVTYQDQYGYDHYSWVIPPNGTLAVDYATRDWQILRLDRDVPGDSVIHLPITNLDVLDRFYDATARVLVVNLNDPTQQLFIRAVTVPGTTPTLPSVNVRDGIVYLDNTFPPGTPVRVYYAAYKSLAQQPVVSYRSYSPAPGNAAPGYRYYTVTFDPSNTAADNSAKTAFLNFSVADIGKVVSVDFHYISLDNNNNPVNKVVLGQTGRIEGVAPVNGIPSGARAAIPYMGPYDTNANQVGFVPDRVKGISFQARGVYLETGDVRRADDPVFANPSTPQIWNPSQVGRLGETTEDVYVPR